jgi:hypothetical protein
MSQEMQCSLFLFLYDRNTYIRHNFFFTVSAVTRFFFGRSSIVLHVRCSLARCLPCLPPSRPPLPTPSLPSASVAFNMVRLITNHTLHACPLACSAKHTKSCLVHQSEAGTCSAHMSPAHAAARVPPPSFLARSSEPSLPCQPTPRLCTDTHRKPLYSNSTPRSERAHVRPTGR